ncbi:MAG: hypothetical protein FWC64_10045 [Treponema sp.]|nr:hypothetical protein [Treponema sp.]
MQENFNDLEKLVAQRVGAPSKLSRTIKTVGAVGIMAATGLSQGGCTRIVEVDCPQPQTVIHEICECPDGTYSERCKPKREESFLLGQPNPNPCECLPRFDLTTEAGRAVARDEIRRDVLAHFREYTNCLSNRGLDTGPDVGRGIRFRLHTTVVTDKFLEQFVTYLQGNAVFMNKLISFCEKSGELLDIDVMENFHIGSPLPAQAVPVPIGFGNSWFDYFKEIDVADFTRVPAGQASIILRDPQWWNSQILHAFYNQIVSKLLITQDLHGNYVQKNAVMGVTTRIDGYIYPPTNHVSSIKEY